MPAQARVRPCPEELAPPHRHAVSVLDCTIRDGGLCNHWDFSRDLVRRTFETLQAVGVEYMEIGYLSAEGAFDRRREGEWRFCDEAALAEVCAAKTGATKVSVMLDVGKVSPADIRPRASSVVDVMRVATYAHQIEGALALTEAAKARGYETFLNLMAVSVLDAGALEATLARVAAAGVDAVAIVDSNGALLPHHIRFLLARYREILGAGVRVGVHTHNNLQQAFANTITAIEEGADFVDATVFGMGRGAGNCPLELLLSYLDSPRYQIDPLFSILEDFSLLREELRWGYHLPYVVTGMQNVHPRYAIERMHDDTRHQVGEMFSAMGKLQDDT